MSLYTNQEYERSELQKKIADSLSDKSKKTSNIRGETDLVDSSAYIEGTKKTTSLAWVWVVIAVAAFAIAFWLLAVGLDNSR